MAGIRGGVALTLDRSVGCDSLAVWLDCNAAPVNSAGWHFVMSPQELRRGADPAHIYSLALSRNCDWLALTSDKGTVHVFALSPTVALTPGAKPGAVPEDPQRVSAPEGTPVTHGINGGGEGGANAATPPRQNPTSFLSIVKVRRSAGICLVLPAGLGPGLVRTLRSRP